MITCILCDTNPSQDCEGCGFGLPVCADCVAADEWLRCSNCTPGGMNRRRVLKLAGKTVGSWLAAGFVGGTSWRAIDSIRPSQNAPKRVRVEVNGMLSGKASGTVVLLTKRGPMA